MSFRGIIAEREYSWGYDCEHCKQKVKKTFKAASRVGREVTAATWTYVTPESEQVMIAEALHSLAGECKAIDLFWTNRSDDAKWLDGIKDNGICPSCGKYQHWASDMRKHGSSPIKKETIGDTIGNIMLSMIVSAVVTGILYLFIGAIFDSWRSSTFKTAMIGFFGLFAVLFLFLLRKVRKDLIKSIESLKNVEKTLPYQMEWSNPTHSTIGLSVRP